MTDELIKELIHCKKIIDDIRRKSFEVKNRSFRNDAYLISEPKKYTFRMFLRQSEHFQEDFSIGLIWTNPEKFLNIRNEIILMRFQGPHDTREDIFKSETHCQYHIHRFLKDDYDNKRFTDPSSVELFSTFSSFSQAVHHFAETCGIMNYNDYSKYLVGEPLNDNQILIDDYIKSLYRGCGENDKH